MAYPFDKIYFLSMHWPFIGAESTKAVRRIWRLSAQKIRKIDKSDG